MGEYHGESQTGTHFNMYKLLVSAALLAAVMADAPPAYAPAPAYHAAPVYKEEKLPPQPFAYEYGVADDYSKANFKKTESQDGNGVVTGSFVIALPDGRIQTTTYTADHHNGFVADHLRGNPRLPPRARRRIRRCTRLQASSRLQARCLIIY